MPELHECEMRLKFHGDDLDPEVLTVRLGATPTNCNRKGDFRRGHIAGQERVERTGGWQIGSGSTTPADPNTSLRGPFEHMSGDLAAWRDLSKRFNGRVSCLLWMSGSNEGFRFNAAMLAAIVERGLALDIEIIAPASDA